MDKIRHSDNQLLRNYGSPKKDGAGGKGTWGKAGEEGDGEDAYHVNDPNHSEDDESTSNHTGIADAGMDALTAQLGGLNVEEKKSEANEMPVEEGLLMAAFLKDTNTVESERASPILGKNMNFLQDELKRDGFKGLFAKADAWKKACGVTDDMVRSIKTSFLTSVKESNAAKTQFDITFIRDGDRNFRTLPHRTVFLHAITYLKAQVLENDYHQGVGLIMSFLLFLVSAPEAIAILGQCAKLNRYVPNYWKGVSIASATDGYVFQSLLAAAFPKVCAHLAANSIWPETYINKWWVALCMNVLSVKTMVTFYDKFFEQGHLFFFKFGLSLVSVFENELIQCSNAGELYGLLRLDADFAPSYMGGEKIVTEANMEKIMSDERLEKFADKVDELGVAGEQGALIDTLRPAMFKKHLKDRLASATEALQNQKKKPDCEECGKDGKGESKCLECWKVLCDDCRERNAGEHDEDAHDVRYNDDWDDDEWEEAGKAIGKC